MHEPVLLSEAIEALAINPEGLYLDGTFGRGGHSRAILEQLGPRGRLIALDRDPQAEEAARSIADPRFSFFRTKFSSLTQVLGERTVDGMLFDLGVSSPQLDDVALMLPQATAHLAPGGRLAVISFHSLEDRIVKRFMQSAARPDVPRRLPLRASEMPQPALKLIGRAVRASAQETTRNPRARSAILRVAERTAGPFNLQHFRIEPGARWRN